MPRTHALLGVALLLAILLLSGCTQTNTQANPLTTLVSKANQITTINYDMTTIVTTDTIGTTNNVTLTSHFWQKPHYMKQQEYVENYTATYISTPNGTYMYNIMTHTWDNSPIPIPNIVGNCTNQMLTAHLTQVGTDVIDGKQTTIVQYQTGTHVTNTTVRAWLWNDNGLPLKIESTPAIFGPNMTTTVLLTNISFDDIPDDVFALS